MSAEPNLTEQLRSQIQRLEESLGFAQHEHEQLSSEVLSLAKRLAEVSRRLDSIENRERLAEAKSAEEPNNDPPPHSAPPMRRDGP